MCVFRRHWSSTTAVRGRARPLSSLIRYVFTPHHVFLCDGLPYLIIHLSPLYLQTKTRNEFVEQVRSAQCGGRALNCVTDAVYRVRHGKPRRPRRRGLRGTSKSPKDMLHTESEMILMSGLF